MINTLDLKKTINNLINENFNIKVLSNKVKDSFKAPAFFTSINTISYEFETKLRNEEAYTVEIHYFPQNFNDDIDMMKTQIKLREIFDRKLKVKNRHLNIYDINDEIHEATLFFRFKLEFQQYKFIENDSQKISEVVFNERID